MNEGYITTEQIEYDSIDHMEELIEETITPEVNAAFEVAEDLAELIESTPNLTEEQKNTYRLSITEHINRFIRSTLRAITYSGILLGLESQYDGYQIEKAQSQDSVVVSEVSGRKKYSHSDEKTTLLLNYLVGKDTLPTDYRWQLYTAILKKRVEDNGKSFPSEALSELDTRAAAEILGIEEKDLKREFSKFSKKNKCSETCAEAIWEIERSVGNPKIRLIEEEGTVMNRAGYYRPESNTVVLSIRSLEPSKIEGGVLLSEFAHSLQFKQHPFKNAAKLARDGIITKITQQIDRTSYSDAQLKEYSKKGTVEHEAHSIIEPTLNKEWSILLKDTFSKISRVKNKT